MNNISLSVCMIVKNESEHLAYAIESIRDIASEIIILDTGSNDNCRGVLHTPIMQCTSPIKIFDFQWNDNFSDARNESLKRATQDWILVFDSDYVLDDDSRKKIIECLNNAAIQLYFLKIRENNMTFKEMDISISFKIETGKETFDETSYEYIKPLLFRNGLGIRFTGNVYEEIENIEKITQNGIADIYINHYNYNSSHLLDKLERNNRIINSCIENVADIRRSTFLRAQKILNLITINEQNKEYIDYSHEIFQLHNEIIKNIPKLEISYFEPFYSKIIKHLFNNIEVKKDAFLLLIENLNLFRDSISILFAMYEFLFNLDKKYECLNILNYMHTICIENITKPGYNLPKIFSDTDLINFFKACLYYEFGDYEGFELHISRIVKFNLFINEYDLMKSKISTPYKNRLSSLLNNVSQKLTSPLRHLRLAKEYTRALEYEKALEAFLIALKLSFEDENLMLQKVIFSEMILYGKELGIDDETFSEIIQEGDLICQNFSYFWYCLGRYYLRTGNLNEAKNKLEVALEIEKNLNSKFNELKDISKNLIDELSLEIYNPYYRELIEKSLEIVKKSEEFQFNSDYKEVEKYYISKEYNQLLEFFQNINTRALNPYEKYVLYDYVSLTNEKIGNYEKAIEIIINSVEIKDDYLEIRKKVIEERQFWKLMQKTSEKFVIYQIEDEWVNCLKEIEKIKPSVVIELGTYKGGSLVSLAKICSNDALLIGVDIPESHFKNEPPSDKDFKKIENEIKCNNPLQKFHIIEDNSHKKSTRNKIEEILNGKKADLLFIDAEHSYNGVKTDYEMYENLVSQDGIVIIHDIKEVPPEYSCNVSDFWNEIVTKAPTKEIISPENNKWGGIGIVFKKNTDKKIYDKFNFVSLCMPRNKVIKPMYDDNIVLLKYCLEDLEMEYTQKFNTLLEGYNNILFFPYSEPEISNYVMDFTYIPFQMEQISLTKFEGYKKASYMRLLKNAVNVWDYSETNIEYLNSIGIDNISLLPFGYHEKMELLDFNREKSIDILFYGEIKDRRLNILDSLIQKGYKVKTLWNVFGKERNNYIEKSKIILNIHSKDDALLEEHRISFLINNKCFVISESSNSSKNNYGNGIIFSDYDKIVETCEFYLKPENNLLRKSIAENGYNVFSRNKMADNLKKVLNNLRSTVSNSPRPLGDPLYKKQRN